jgi:acyl transferase domain-containing protein
VYNRPGYVKAGAVLDNADRFDPAFWGLSQREAIYMDPQHRLFLECCWHALEYAGYAPSQYGARTGVFAGTFLPTYLLHHLRGGGLMEPSNPGLAHLTEIGNDKDYLATRVSHLLNLQGPSLSVQTSCSTGLVAVATACQSLLAGQCDVALAGASSMTFPQAGYQYLEGFVYSHDGQCRAFDAEASGTVLGDGVGVLVLKRLEDAEMSGDHMDLRLTMMEISKRISLLQACRGRLRW